MPGPPAARITDMHTCPGFNGPVPHVGGPVIGPCSFNVLTGSLPQARITDLCLCVGPPDAILMGSPTVLVNNLMAARIGDPTTHGGVIVSGCPTVLIGGASGMGGGPGGAAGGPGGAAAAEGESPFKIGGEVSASQKPFDAEPESSTKIVAEYALIDGKDRAREAWKIGDDDNHLRVLTADAEAKATAGYDIDKREFEAAAEASAGVAVAKGQVSGKAGDGLVSGKATGELGALSASAKAGVSASPQGAKAGAELGAEAVAARAKAEGEVRITPYTVYNNSVGRMTGTALPKSWDKGITVGGSAEAGIGAAAKAKAEAAIGAREASVLLEGKAGLGPMAGLAGKLGVVW